MSALWLGAKGTVSAETRILRDGLPCLLSGTWLGPKLSSRFDEAILRKTVLVLGRLNVIRSETETDKKELFVSSVTPMF
jgi:hypothetical protein